MIYKENFNLIHVEFYSLVLKYGSGQCLWQVVVFLFQESQSDGEARCFLFTAGFTNGGMVAGTGAGSWPTPQWTGQWVVLYIKTLNL